MLHLLDDRSDPLFDETLLLWFFLSPFYMEEGKTGGERGKTFFWITDKEKCYGKTVFQYLKDEFWASYCNFFYVHTTLRTANHDRSIAGSVHQNCKVCFPGNIQCFCNHHLKTDRGKKRKPQWFCSSLILAILKRNICFTAFPTALQPHDLFPKESSLPE